MTVLSFVSSVKKEPQAIVKIPSVAYRAVTSKMDGMDISKLGISTNFIARIVVQKDFTRYAECVTQW